MNRATVSQHPVVVRNFEKLDGRLLVLFDGQCGFCNHAVRWFLTRDRQDRLRFAPSDADGVAAILARHGFSGNGALQSPSTILVVHNTGSTNESVLERSDAVLAMLRALPRPWLMVAFVLGMVPRFLRDLGYRLIARLRHRLADQPSSCFTFAAKEREHFL